MHSLDSSTRVGPYTWDDFASLDEGDLRELIDGELVEVEVNPTFAHERVVARLVFHLIRWSCAGHGGDAIGSNFGVKISDKNGFMPDVMFFREENPVREEDYKGMVVGRPDLVVEVISPSSVRYDRVKKLRGYAARAVPEYWIVDPEQRTLERLLLEEGRYVIAASLEESDVLRPPTFPDLEIPLADLWLKKQ
jgi:Uma2 family endonuclease